LIASTCAIIGKHALDAAARSAFVVVVRGSLVVMALVLIAVLLLMVVGSGAPVSVAATASSACAPGTGMASRMNSGLAVQSPANVMAATIRMEALICGRIFVVGLEADDSDGGTMMTFDTDTTVR
jgi:hypothetical protein